jgi:hypothetical protein
MAPAGGFSYAACVSRRAASKPPGLIAHERAILDNWIEDDDVYVTLREGQTGRERASGRGAAFAVEGSTAAAASLLLPTPR